MFAASTNHHLNLAGATTMRERQQMGSSSFDLSQKSVPQEPTLSESSDAEFAFSFNVAVVQIIELFEEIVQAQNFSLIESEQNHATAIRHGKKSFMQLIDCFSWWSEGSVTAIKMNITTRQKDSKRICRIRGLVGSRREVAQFIEKFRIRSQALAASKHLPLAGEEELESGEHQTNPFYLESCASYMFHKILSNEKYGLGSILHSSINNFKAEFKGGAKWELLPMPMKKAVSICDEAVAGLYKDFNYGRQETEQIMPYCRISVEKYVFEKIYSTLDSLYSNKNQSLHRTFTLKVQKIRASLTPRIIFNDIGLNPDLTFCPDSEPDLDTVGALSSIPTCQVYAKAIQEFEKIGSTESPRQKVKHCQIMYTYLKTAIFEESRGTKQLFNMEDIIPMLIFVLIVTKVKELKNELDMMVDFIGFDPCDLESERRLLVNLSESYNYVARDWKLE